MDSIGETPSKWDTTKSSETPTPPPPPGLMRMGGRMAGPVVPEKLCDEE